MKKIGATIMVATICFTLSAQDLHYWTNQFGTRSSLLGGAVVGGIKDNTAIFYNPTEANNIQGRLPFAQAKYFSIGLLLGYTYMFKK